MLFEVRDSRNALAVSRRTSALRQLLDQPSQDRRVFRMRHGAPTKWAPHPAALCALVSSMRTYAEVRLVAGDRESGALKLEFKQAMGSFPRLAAKAIVLPMGWLIAMLPVF